MQKQILGGIVSLFISCFTLGYAGKAIQEHPYFMKELQRSTHKNVGSKHCKHKSCDKQTQMSQAVVIKGAAT